MRSLVVLTIVGFAAQLVDGSLGMGFGVTSTSLLLLTGMAPAIASASVHIAELGSNVVSGVAHHRMKNTDWRLVMSLGIPGAIGGFVGAFVLSNLSLEAATPLMAGLLTTLGGYIVVRFAFRPPAEAEARRSPHGKRFLAPLGLVGGFVDATGGGGWGPITTSSLLSAAKTSPRTVIGSVATAETLVSFATTAGFVIALGLSGVRIDIVVALLLGGIVAAPIAAWLVSRLPSRVMGVAVGGFIVILNLHAVLASLGVPTTIQIGVTLILGVAWLVLMTLTYRRHREVATATRQSAEVLGEGHTEPAVQDRASS